MFVENLTRMVVLCYQYILLLVRLSLEVKFDKYSKYK